MRSARGALLLAGACCGGSLSLLPCVRAQSISAQEFARCAAITADADRLVCYDRFARGDEGGRRVPPAPLMPESARAPEQSFGLAKPPAEKPAEKPTEPSQMEARIRAVTSDSSGNSVVQLDNDQSWTVDDGPVMVRLGDGIVIKRAALGSFLMNTPTNRVYRVRRLR